MESRIYKELFAKESIIMRGKIENRVENRYCNLLRISERYLKTQRWIVAKKRP